MRTSIKTLTAFVSIILLSSFASKNTDMFIGTYGVCSSDPSQIQLTMNADHTFTYRDFSASNKKVEIAGNWTSKGNKVFLKSNSSNTKFHSVWVFIDQGKAVRSRKGLAFYRLVKLD